MRTPRLATNWSAALALGLLDCVAPAASVLAFVAPWAIAVGVGDQGIPAAATAPRAAAAETSPPPAYPPSYPPASPPQDQVCQTLRPSPPDTHEVTVCHYE